MGILGGFPGNFGGIFGGVFERLFGGGFPRIFGISWDTWLRMKRGFLGGSFVVVFQGILGSFPGILGG